MAAATSGIELRVLDGILKQTVSAPLFRDAAAALTVAFEIRKAIGVYKNAQETDQMIIDEIKRVYRDFVVFTDPVLSQAQAQQAVQPKRG